MLFFPGWTQQPGLDLISYLMTVPVTCIIDTVTAMYLILKPARSKLSVPFAFLFGHHKSVPHIIRSPHILAAQNERVSIASWTTL